MIIKTHQLNAIVMLITSVIMVKGQVGIGTSSPDPSANLHVAPRNTANQNKGTLLGTMTTQNRNSIAQPATGLMIYNTTDNCLQVNNGTPAIPKWECLSESPDAFGSMNFGYYKPVYPGLISNFLSSPLPINSSTNPQLYGSYSQYGNFASNDLFQLNLGKKQNDSYSALLYNISGEEITLGFFTNANNQNNLPSYNLANTRGIYLDWNYTAYYTEPQNTYLVINTPAKWAGRKFLIGFNVFRESNASGSIPNDGNGNQRQSQSMLTYIFEIK